MMDKKIPVTPFSTRLSGSVKEIETRVRGILGGEKKRPPVPLLLLAGVSILLCGNLVSCQGQMVEQSQTIYERLPTGILMEGAQWVEEDMDGDGLPELVSWWERGFEVYEAWEDGSIRRPELDAAALRVLGVQSRGWPYAEMRFYPGDKSVGLQWPSQEPWKGAQVELASLLARSHGGDVVVPGSGGVWEVLRERTEEGEQYISYCTGLDLDGMGVDEEDRWLDRDGQPDGDDWALAMTWMGDDAHPEGRTLVAAELGSGKVLTWEQDWGHGGAEMFPVNLTSPERHSILLEQDVFGSNYGAALYRVLDVEDGALVARSLEFGEELASLSDSYVEERLSPEERDSVHIPTHVSKWHYPAWSELSRTEEGLTLTQDDYFTDCTMFRWKGRYLTLEFRGRWTEDGSLYYDQIQVFEGEDLLLQTITPQDAGREMWPTSPWGRSYEVMDKLSGLGEEDDGYGFRILAAEGKTDVYHQFLWNGNEFYYSGDWAYSTQEEGDPFQALDG